MKHGVKCEAVEVHNWVDLLQVVNLNAEILGELRHDVRKSLKHVNGRLGRQGFILFGVICAGAVTIKELYDRVENLECKVNTLMEERWSMENDMK